MTAHITEYIIFTLLGGGLSWASWVTLKLTKVHHDLKILNEHLSLVDWSEMPQKNLNKVFNKA